MYMGSFGIDKITYKEAKGTKGKAKGSK